jgi:integrase
LVTPPAFGFLERAQPATGETTRLAAGPGIQQIHRGPRRLTLVLFRDVRNFGTLEENPAEPMLPFPKAATMARKRYQKPEPYRAIYGTGKNRKEFWVIRYREDVLTNGTTQRRARKVKLGETATMSKHEAERARDRVLSPINGFDYNPARGETFGELARRYLEHVLPTREPGTADMHEWHLNKFLIPFFDNYRLEFVNPETAQRLVAQLQKNGGKDGTPMRRPSIEAVIKTLTGLFKVFREWGYQCPEIRVSRLKLPDYVPTPGASKLYQPDEARTLFGSLDRQTEFVTKLQSAFLLRPSEILGLSKFDFDFDRNLVRIERKSCARRSGELRILKNKTPKVVPLAPEARRLVEEWMRDGYIENRMGLLFRREKSERSLVQKTLRRRLHKAQDALGQARRGLHGFRHTAASIVANETGSVLTAAKLLGHGNAERVNAKTTLKYLHSISNEEMQGARAVARMLLGAKPAKKRPGRVRTQNLCPDVSGASVKVVTA